MSWAVGNLRMRSIRLKFGFALPSASSCYLGKARKRSLPSVRYSVPPCTSAIQTSLMALGCCVGFLVLFVHNRRCQRGQCKRSLQIAERRGGRQANENSSSRGSDQIARRRLKKRFNYFGSSPK